MLITINLYVNTIVGDIEVIVRPFGVPFEPSLLPDIILTKFVQQILKMTFSITVLVQQFVFYRNKVLPDKR